MTLLRAFVRNEAGSASTDWCIIGALVLVAFASGLSALSTDLKPIYIDMSQDSTVRR